MIYADSSYICLNDVLMMPGLGINLIFCRQICQSTCLRGSFDKNFICFKLNKSSIITAIMREGLYIVAHIAKSCKDLALNTQKCFVTTGKTIVYLGDNSADNIITDPTNTCVNDNNLTTTEKERQLLYYRHSAHLGSRKPQNLHLVTSFKRPIKLPNLREDFICEACLRKKMSDSTSKELLEWKTPKLTLVDFDVADPFPPTIRDNKWFILIVDSYTRKL